MTAHKKEEEEVNQGVREQIEVLKKIAVGDHTARAREDMPNEIVAELGKDINLVAKSLQEVLEQSHQMGMGLSQHFEVLNRLSNGDVKARISGAKIGEEVIDTMSEQINHIGSVYEESVAQSMELSLAIAQFLEILSKVAAGDYTVRVPQDFEMEVLASLGKSINLAIAKVEERSGLEELLKELSTPVLHAWEGVIVMPLIGTLTSNRAQEAMERVLNSITEKRAKVAIIDITGVAVVDTMVAQHLIRTIKAVKVLGSDAIITGISAEVASILVKIGVEVEQLVTRSSLREGLQYAIKLIEQNK
jgi:anti-anti-sigma regulatory factor